MDDFPSNSHRTREPSQDKKREKVERITSGEAVRRRKPLGRQFKETFVGGDARSAVTYVIFDVIVPSARDMMFDAFTEGMHRMIFGDSKRRGPHSRPGSPGGPLGRVSYESLYKQYDKPPPPRSMSRRGRSNHDFGEIVLTSRAEATEVVDAMFELASKYDSVSVADLYEMIGLESTHTDYDWGWNSLQGADIMKVRGGYLLDLPAPQPLK